MADHISLQINKGSCLPGTSNSYVLVKNERMNWRDAQKYCRKHHSDLASVRNATESQIIESKIQSIDTSHYVWIGLFNDNWVWSKKSNSSFRYWTEGAPPNNDETDKGALTLLTTQEEGKWRDMKCDNKYPFFCHFGNIKFSE